MRNKLKVTITGCALAFSIFSTTAFAANTLNVSGGWSESGGYYINDDSNISNNTEMVLSTGTPSATPNSHKGTRLNRLLSSGGDTESAAHGETVWFYKYHYTTARMELSNGTVKTTSGRQWGQNATEATSLIIVPVSWKIQKQERIGEVKIILNN